eukprot:9497791-Pyramimonas_sp.AAC.1
MNNPIDPGAAIDEGAPEVHSDAVVKSWETRGLNMVGWCASSLYQGPLIAMDIEIAVNFKLDHIFAHSEKLPSKT